MARSDPARGHLATRQRDELAELAESVLEEYSSPDKRIDPVAIARAAELLLVFGSYGEAFDGLLRHRNGRFTIFCNLERVEHERSHRARFVLGHELGHYFISAHRNALASGLAPQHPSFCEYESKLFVEQQADCFASNLLLPRTQFEAAAKKVGIGNGLGTILAIAQKFDTSVTSTAIRFASLNIAPCIVIKWDSNRYGWKWLSDSAYDAGYRRTIEDKSKVLAGSATALAFEGASLPAEGFFKRATTAEAWFPFVQSGSQKNVILYEHAKPLGRYGVLTMLVPESGSF